MTKKQRKLRDGMNAITKAAYEKGHTPPLYVNRNEGKALLPEYIKVGKGVPYVNPLNFGV